MQFNVVTSATLRNRVLEIVVIERTNICDDNFDSYYRPCTVQTTELTLIQMLDDTWTFLDSERRPYTFYWDYSRYHYSDRGSLNLNEYHYSKSQYMIPFKLNINIKYSRLPMIPSGLVTRAVHFNASNLMIKEIKKDDFASAKNLEELDLSFNEISSVPEFVFAGASQLETIDLSHNEIEVIHPNAFSSESAEILKINRIYLNHNRIIKLQDKSFPEGLLYLTLNDNQIKEIDSQAMPSLQTLALDNNDALSVIPNMNVIYISLRNTSATTLAIYESTIEIDATDSAIQIIEVMGLNENQLQKLILRSNSLTYLSWIAPLTNLEILDISLNQLEEIDGEVLTQLTNLRQLNASNNQILEIDQQFLQYTTNLRILDLSYNKLDNFQLEQKAVNLELLGIAGNGLLTLDTDLRQMAPNLRSINVNNNNWTCQHLFISLVLLHYDGIVPIDGTNNLTAQENPGISHISGIRCFQPLSNYRDAFVGTTSAPPSDDRKIDIDEVNNLVDNKLNQLLKIIQESLENKMKQLDSERATAN